MFLVPCSCCACGGERPWGDFACKLEMKSNNASFEQRMEVGPAIRVRGFYDGGGIYKIRFMPTRSGQWTFVTRSNVDVLSGHKADFRVAKGSVSDI